MPKSTEIAYRCQRCGSGYTFEETGSTDAYYCKKHTKVKYDRQEAAAIENHCRIVERSRCPTCGSWLSIDKLSTGQFYLKCVDCDWNSNQKTPIIVASQEKQVIKEADKFGLSQKGELCNEKFRMDRGREYCKKCFLDTLRLNTETSFSTLQAQYGLNPDEIEHIISDLVRAKQIEGQLDKNAKIFINLTATKQAQLVADLQTQGTMEIGEIQKRFSVTEENARKIMIDTIRKGNLRGTFTNKGDRYYLETGLNQRIIQTIKAQGKISHRDLAMQLDIHEGNLKKFIMSLMKNNMIIAFFGDNGNLTISSEFLDSETESYCLQNGYFMISQLASHLKIAPELARKTLFNLIQKGGVRGIFTQNYEFITEEALGEKVKSIARAYRTIALSELAKKLAITEQRVEESLAALISRSAISGYIDVNKKQFIADAVQPTSPTPFAPPVGFSTGSQTQPTGAAPMPPGTPMQSGQVEVVRQYDFVGGQLHFKVIVKNNTNMAITAIKVILDVPSSYRRARDMITIPVIDPGNTHGVDFYLEPAECGISTIGGTVLYKDALGRANTIFVQPKDVQIKCPLVIKTLDTIEDCQKAIQSLPSDARAFLVADLPPQMAYSAAHRAISQFDTRNVASFEDDKSGTYEAESWFSSEAKVTGGRVITRIYLNGSNSTLELRVWCNDAGQLTGFLAKIVEVLFVEINLMRKIKAEERNKTLDVMSITRSLMELSDICMLRYKASSAKIKLEDVHVRLARVTCNCDDIRMKIDDWIKKMDAYENEANIKDEDADALEKEVSSIHQILQAQIGA